MEDFLNCDKYLNCGKFTLWGAEKTIGIIILKANTNIEIIKAYSLNLLSFL